MRTAVVVNPASARGRTGRRWSDIAAILKQRIGAFDCALTTEPGGAEGLTRAFLRSGCERIVAVGGDGTLHEAANAFLSEPNDAVLGLIPVATAGDLARMLHIPRDPARAVEVIAEGRFRTVDAGRIGERYFLNMASFGLGGLVAERIRNSRVPLGYLPYALLALASSKPAEVALSIDGGPVERMCVSHVAIGNGQFHGGGMRLCPMASMDDGLLDVTVIEGIGLAEVLLNAALIYNGKIHSHPKVRHWRAKRIMAESAQPVPLEIDGEVMGHLPIETCVVPGAIRLIAPGG